MPVNVTMPPMPGPLTAVMQRSSDSGSAVSTTWCAPPATGGINTSSSPLARARRVVREVLVDRDPELAAQLRDHRMAFGKRTDRVADARAVG